MLFVGGGAGAGKSTVVDHFLSSSFWSSGVIHDAVKVDVDELKQTDVIYRQLARLSPDDRIGNADLVHQHCTSAALSLLVSALNEGRDVIFDGTMSREHFVLQTMDMVRDIHKRWYRMGPAGFKGSNETMKYWEPLTHDDERAHGVQPKDGKRPYRIEFVGVVCDAHLAAVRGLRRAIATNRGVLLEFLLRSHKMFVKSLEKYISMVDAAKIFSTSAWNGPAELIAIKDGPGKKLLIDIDTIYPGVRLLEDLNTKAGSVMELFKCYTDNRFVNQYWHKEILNPERKIRQERLKTAILDHAPTSALLERSSSESSSDAEFATKELNRSSSDDDLPTKGWPSSDHEVLASQQELRSV
ncbi:hypothetical protein M758_12G124900 [Ceratodon purpureus]|nr:hypothetical protein M758_12G124900 [Ceratodon purpureus]KAG0599066.1 hypothetical protein M758_12G124900 [Ceratodon purpureus]